MQINKMNNSILIAIFYILLKDLILSLLDQKITKFSVLYLKTQSEYEMNFLVFAEIIN